MGGGSLERGRSSPAVGVAIAVLALAFFGSIPTVGSATALAPGPLLFSALFGGACGPEYASNVAVDAAGNVYVAGETCAHEFLTTSGALNRSFPETEMFRAFLLKLNRTRGLVYSTFLGGMDGFWADNVNGLAVDPQGYAYVVGMSNASDFPTTPGAFDGTVNGNAENGFVTSLTLTGATSIGRRGEFPWLYVVVPVAVAVAGILAFVLWRRRRRPASPPAPPAV